jgi:hypothetical protein
MQNETRNHETQNRVTNPLNTSLEFLMKLKSTMLSLTWFIAILSLAAIGAAQVPSSHHVVVVVEENHGYDSVIGNGAMPYLNSLASQYGLATQYYANTHPSIGNYFMMTAGQIITNDDGYSGTVTADNLVRHLLSSGKPGSRMPKACPMLGTRVETVGPMCGATIRFRSSPMSSIATFGR